MRILVIELQNADPSVLLENEQLVNLRYLMDMGCWGTLEAKRDESWTRLANRLTAIAKEDCSRVTISRTPDQSGSYEELDARIGSQLEAIVDGTIVSIVCSNSDGTPGYFALAAPNSPLNGRLDGVRLDDIATTILTLGGFPPLPDSQGVPLAQPVDPANKVDDEEMIRERLRGLGYIA